MLKMGTGSKTFYIVAQITNMGINRVEIRLTDNVNYAKVNMILGKLKAESIEEAKEYFRIVDMTRYD